MLPLRKSPSILGKCLVWFPQLDSLDEATSISSLHMHAAKTVEALQTDGLADSGWFLTKQHFRLRFLSTLSYSRDRGVYPVYITLN